MPSSGSTTLTPVGPGTPPSTIPAPLAASCISLARYAELIMLDNECAFWGVQEDDVTEYACKTYWTEYERSMIARYLAEAQDEIEQVVGYPLCPTWFTDERHKFTGNPVMADWGYVISGGVMGETDIAISEAISYATEPATVGPIATTLTDTSEIKVFYPGSEREITPQSIEISGGFLTIWIPRCRLVDPDHFNYTDTPLDYNTIANFLATVDVKRIYNDESTHAELVYPHRSSNSVCDCSCDDYTQDACIYVRNGTIGQLDVQAASYSGGWTVSSASCLCGMPEYVLLNYYAGRILTYQAEDAIIRLAHSKMPDEPCGCEIAQRLWGRDRNVPEVLTAQRLNCPFGMSDGAWIAWRFANAMKVMKSSTMITKRAWR
jgi:hypothetical protein